MGHDFDADKDREALMRVARPSVTPLDRQLLEQERKEHEEARAELMARKKVILRDMEGAKTEWLWLNLSLGAPEWAVRWTMAKKRGWILRIFSVTLDHIAFDTFTEVFIIRKGGKMLATKMFRWNGTHLEGKIK